MPLYSKLKRFSLLGPVRALCYLLLHINIHKKSFFILFCCAVCQVFNDSPRFLFFFSTPLIIIKKNRKSSEKIKKFKKNTKQQKSRANPGVDQLFNLCRCAKISARENFQRPPIRIPLKPKDPFVAFFRIVVASTPQSLAASGALIKSFIVLLLLSSFLARVVTHRIGVGGLIDIIRAKRKSQIKSFKRRNRYFFLVFSPIFPLFPPKKGLSKFYLYFMLLYNFCYLLWVNRENRVKSQ